MFTSGTSIRVCPYKAPFFQKAAEPATYDEEKRGEPSTGPTADAPVKPAVIDPTQVEVEDMVNVMTSFIKNDQLNLIALWHLAVSDRKGIYSEEANKVVFLWFCFMTFVVVFDVCLRQCSAKRSTFAPVHHSEM